MDDSKTRLPIKVVIPKQTDFFRPVPGGSQRKIFGDPGNELRSFLVNQVEQVYEYFRPAFRKHPRVPAVAQVKLKEEALAKSHRPVNLFDRATCPLIGVDGLGELLVSVQPSGLERLAERINSTGTNTGVADISTIESIEAYSASDVLGSDRALAMLKEHLENNAQPVKMRLFRHPNAISNDELLKAFMEEIEELRLPSPEEIQYASNLLIYRIRDIGPASVLPLASFIGTQKLSMFPHYNTVRTQFVPLGRATEADFPQPEPDLDYPVIGIIDTGVDPANRLLSPWVTRREIYVPEQFRSYDHGTFVAGLIVHSRLMNGNDERFPAASAKIIDIVAVPENGISEDELLSIIEESVKNCTEAKIWNLSLANTSRVCEDKNFSDMAAALDRIQDEHGVTFVIACGNYSTPPLRGWPPENLGEADRVCPPGDSVRALTVGSIAHLCRSNSCVGREEPSPFSRRGPGPASLPKPELVHYGGNCDRRGDYTQTGVISLGSGGRIVENIGTSFSTPLVSTLLANVGKAIIGEPSPNLTKALLVHSARLASKLMKVDDLRYRGFGVPSDVTTVLSCAPWMATLIMEPELMSGRKFEKLPFPIPSCLKGPGHKVKAEVLMTVVYDPPVDTTFGSEYCRRNLEVSLGTYELDADGRMINYEGKVPPEPKDITQRYEKFLVEHGFKWSPIKTYRREMKRVAGENWRLYVELLDRSGFSSEEPQTFALLITVLDPDRKQPVYDEVVRFMNREGWITVDLEVQERIRSKAS